MVKWSYKNGKSDPVSFLLLADAEHAYEWLESFRAGTVCEDAYQGAVRLTLGAGEEIDLEWTAGEWVWARGRAVCIRRLKLVRPETKEEVAGWTCSDLVRIHSSLLDETRAVHPHKSLG
jgi:hypothetical protein